MLGRRPIGSTTPVTRQYSQTSIILTLLGTEPDAAGPGLRYIVYIYISDLNATAPFLGRLDAVFGNHQAAILSYSPEAVDYNKGQTNARL